MPKYEINILLKWVALSPFHSISIQKNNFSFIMENPVPFSSKLITEKQFQVHLSKDL